MRERYIQYMHIYVYIYIYICICIYIYIMRERYTVYIYIYIYIWHGELSSESSEYEVLSDQDQALETSKEHEFVFGTFCLSGVISLCASACGTYIHPSLQPCSFLPARMASPFYQHHCFDMSELSTVKYLQTVCTPGAGQKELILWKADSLLLELLRYSWESQVTCCLSDYVAIPVVLLPSVFDWSWRLICYWRVWRHVGSTYIVQKQTKGP